MSYGLDASGELPDEPIVGSVTPRISTPPLRELTPETSYGFDVIDFARDVLGIPLDPWQEWLVIHLGELLSDGRPRFRVALVLVARQNGKTTLCKILILYWLFVEKIPLILGTSTDRSYAKRTWQDIVAMAKDNKWLSAFLTSNSERKTIGEETFKTREGAEYTFAANNGRAARSMTLHRWLCDEIREHHSRDCWASASNAMNAVTNRQTIAISNQGDDESVVLDSLRDPAIEFIETGQGDSRLGLFEWSGPPGAEPDDLHAIAQANPNLGIRLDVDALVADGRKAKRAGGKELADYRTEVLCQRVALLDPAIDPDLWAKAFGQLPDLANHRSHVALCLDVSLDGFHASLVAAAELDGLVYVDVVAAWSGFGCTKELRDELPDIVAKVRPRALGWFPNGPAAVLAADMREKKSEKWPPRRVSIETITTDTASVCMSMAELVKSGEVVHGNDPMLNAHVSSAQRLRTGDRWVFTRRNTGPVDGAYAIAGAVHLARTLPPALPPLVVI